MKLACSSYSYHEELDNEMGFEEFVRICDEKLQIEGIEIIDEHLPNTTDEALDRVVDITDEHGVDIACLSVFYNDFAKATDEERQDDVRKVKTWLDRADRLGAPVLRAFTGFPGLHDRSHDDTQVWSDVTSSLQECLDYAQTVETTLAIENHNHDGLIRTADDVFRVRSQVNGNLGLVLDLSNYVDGVESVERTLHLADHVHAAYDDIADDGSEPTHTYYDDVLGALSENEYEGYVTLEFEAETDSREAVPAAIEYLNGVS